MALLVVVTSTTSPGNAPGLFAAMGLLWLGTSAACLFATGGLVLALVRQDWQLAANVVSAVVAFGAVGAALVAIALALL